MKRYIGLFNNTYWSKVYIRYDRRIFHIPYWSVAGGAHPFWDAWSSRVFNPIKLQHKSQVGRMVDSVNSQRQNPLHQFPRSESATSWRGKSPLCLLCRVVT